MHSHADVLDVTKGGFCLGVPSRFSRIRNTHIGFSAALLMPVLASVQPTHAKRVIVEFVAEAKTVTGMPFGITVPRLTVVRGYFTYETNTPDLRPADLMRGQFLMLDTSDFRAEFLDKVIAGSDSATATTNLFGSPTLSFNDGGNKSDRGIMSDQGVLPYP